MIVNGKVYCDITDEFYTIINSCCELPAEILAMISLYIKCEYKTYFVIGHDDWDNDYKLYVLIHFKNEYPLIVHPINLGRIILSDALRGWVERYFYKNYREILK